METVSFDDVRRRVARGELVALLTAWLPFAHGDALAPQAEYHRFLRANAHRLRGDGADDALLSLALTLPEGALVRRDAEAWLRERTPTRPWIRQLAGPGAAGAAVWRFHDDEMGWFAGRGLAVSPDGRRIALSSRDGLIRVFDLDTTACVARLAAHKKPVTALAWSADGSLLASGSEDRQLALWDVASHSLRWVTRAHVGAVASVLHLPDGRVASLGVDGSLKLWKANAPKAVATLAAGGRHTGAMVSLGDLRVATVGYQQPTRVWDLTSRTLLHELPTPTGWNFSAAAVPTAPRLVTTGVETVLWDFVRGERLADFHLGGRDVVVDPSGERAYVGTEEGDVWALDLARGERLGVLATLGHRPAALALVPGAQVLATLDLDGELSLWDLRAPLRADDEPVVRHTSLVALRSHPALVTGDHQSGWWEPERGEYVETGPPDLHIRSTETGERRFVLEGARLPAIELGDGTLLTAVGDRDAARWDVATGARLGTFPGRLQHHESRGTSLGRLAPDGEHVVHVEPEGDGDAVVVWSARSGRTARRLAHPGKVLTAIPLAGGRVVSVEVGGAVRVFAQEGDAPPSLARPDVAGGVARSTRVTRDGASAVSIVGRSVVRWSTATGEVLGQAKVRAELRCLALHPDGARVLAVDKAALHVIDLAAGKAVARFPAEAGPLTHVLAHADGRHAFTLDGHWHHALWDLDAGSCLGRWAGINAGMSSPCDGGWWASMAWRGPLELIDVATGQCAARWWPEEPFHAVHVLSEGRVFVAGRTGAWVLRVEGS